MITLTIILLVALSPLLALGLFLLNCWVAYGLIALLRSTSSTRIIVKRYTEYDDDGSIVKRTTEYDDGSIEQYGG